MTRGFINAGHGYKTPSVWHPVPDTFHDRYKVLLHPCPTRESRVFDKTDFSSHDIRLATEMCGEHESGLYILVNHGGGSETWCIDFQAKRLRALFMNLPEQDAYLLLFNWLDSLSTARREAATETGTMYAQAFVDKRLKKVRRNNRVRVEILPPPATEIAA